MTAYRESRSTLDASVLVGTYAISKDEIRDAAGLEFGMCPFCRVEKAKLPDGTCSTYCSDGEFGWFRRLEGTPYPSDQEHGRGWLSA